MKRFIVLLVALAVLLPGGGLAATYNEKLLARVITAEAGGSSHKAMVAVGNVVMNRVRCKRFANTIRGVVYARGQFAVARRYNKRALKAAKAVLRGARVLPKNVYYFRAASKRSRWPRRGMYKRIGGNVFYKFIR